MPPAYESRRAVSPPWWLNVLLWTAFAGSLAAIPATSQLFTSWGGDGSGALPWVWLVPAVAALIALIAVSAKRRRRILAVEYEGV